MLTSCRTPRRRCSSAPPAPGLSARRPAPPAPRGRLLRPRGRGDEPGRRAAGPRQRPRARPAHHGHPPGTGPGPRAHGAVPRRRARLAARLRAGRAAANRSPRPPPPPTPRRTSRRAATAWMRPRWRPSGASIAWCSARSPRRCWPPGRWRRDERGSPRALGARVPAVLAGPRVFHQPRRGRHVRRVALHGRGRRGPRHARADAGFRHRPGGRGRALRLRPRARRLAGRDAVLRAAARRHRAPAAFARPFVQARARGRPSAGHPPRGLSPSNRARVAPARAVVRAAGDRDVRLRPQTRRVPGQGARRGRGLRLRHLARRLRAGLFAPGAGRLARLARRVRPPAARGPRSRADGSFRLRPRVGRRGRDELPARAAGRGGRPVVSRRVPRRARARPSPRGPRSRRRRWARFIGGCTAVRSPRASTCAGG